MIYKSHVSALNKKISRKRFITTDRKQLNRNFSLASFRNFKTKLEQNKFLLFYSHNNKGFSSTSLSSFFLYLFLVTISFYSSVFLSFLPYTRLSSFNTMLNFLPHLYQTYCMIAFSGWSSGAKVLGKLSVPGRSTYLVKSRARAYCSKCGRVLFGHFFSRLYLFFSVSLSGRRPDTN